MITNSSRLCGAPGDNVLVGAGTGVSVTVAVGVAVDVGTGVRVAVDDGMAVAVAVGVGGAKGGTAHDTINSAITNRGRVILNIFLLLVSDLK